MALQKSYNTIAALPLFLVLFIDGMGLGILFPVLNALLVDSSSGFLGAAFPPSWHNLIYGAVVGIFMLSWFFGAAFLGESSDKIGRRKALLICLWGTALSSLLSAVAVIFHSLTLIVMGRMIAGLTAGSQPIAQAAIIDLSVDETKARNIGFILLSMSLGFILGPLLGGMMIDVRLVSWFGPAVPLFFSSFLAAINIALLMILFKGTYRLPFNQAKLQHRGAINIFASAFQHKPIRMLSILFFVFMLGWSSFYSFISMFLIKRYGLSASEVSYFMALMGLGFCIGNGVLFRFIIKYVSLINGFLISSLIAAAIVLLMLIAKSDLLSWLLIIPMAAAIALAYAMAVTLFSNQVDAQSQGWAMGITGSIMAFVFGVDALIGGLLASMDTSLPLILSAASLLLAGIIPLIFQKGYVT